MKKESGIKWWGVVGCAQSAWKKHRCGIITGQRVRVEIFLSRVMLYVSLFYSFLLILAVLFSSFSVMDSI